jgi:hypothetical protein
MKVPSAKSLLYRHFSLLLELVTEAMPLAEREARIPTVTSQLFERGVNVTNENIFIGGYEINAGGNECLTALMKQKL